jgi:hypothetical protein
VVAFEQRLSDVPAREDRSTENQDAHLRRTSRADGD